MKIIVDDEHHLNVRSSSVEKIHGADALNSLSSLVVAKKAIKNLRIATDTKAAQNKRFSISDNKGINK